MVKIIDYDIKMKKSPFLNPIIFREDEIFRKWSNEIYKFLGDMIGGIEQSKLTRFQRLKK